MWHLTVISHTSVAVIFKISLQAIASKRRKQSSGSNALRHSFSKGTCWKLPPSSTSFRSLSRSRGACVAPLASIFCFMPRYAVLSWEGIDSKKATRAFDLAFLSISEVDGLNPRIYTCGYEIHCPSPFFTNPQYAAHVAMPPKRDRWNACHHCHCHANLQRHGMRAL